MAYLVQEHMDVCGLVCTKCKVAIVKSFSGQRIELVIGQKEYSDLREHQEKCKGKKSRLKRKAMVGIG